MQIYRKAALTQPDVIRNAREGYRAFLIFIPNVFDVENHRRRRRCRHRSVFSLTCRETYR